MQVWPSKTLLQKTRGALLEKCLLPLVLLDVGHFLVGLVRFLVLLLGFFLSENVLKITSGRQNVKLLWHLFKLFIVLYALGCVLGKYMHILP